MSNYIRACFCVASSIPAARFYDLLVDLERLNWRYNSWTLGQVSGYLTSTEQEIDVKEQVLYRDFNPEKIYQLAEWLAVPGYLNIDFGYRIGDKIYSAGILHFWQQENRPRRITIAIEEEIFLPGKIIEFTPNGSAAFDSFKQLMVQVIRHLKPTVGAMDYDDDWLCEEPNSRREDSLISWGNYFSQPMIHRWTKDDIATLLETVDEHLQIDALGILTFIHPLAANQAWTSKHEKVHALLMRNVAAGNWGDKGTQE